MHEIVGGAAAEGLGGVGREAEGRLARGGAAQFRTARENRVDFLAVERRDVLDVLNVLQAPLDLEGGDARVDQGFEIRSLIVVLEAENMASLREHRAVFGRDVVGEAAELRAGAAVGAAPQHGFRHVALARVTYAKRPVHEEFNAGLRQSRAHGADRVEVEFAREDELREAHLLEESRFFGRPDVALGRGVDLDVGQGAHEKAHVLQDQDVHARLLGVEGERPRRLDFVVAKEGVEGHEDAGVPAVCVVAESRDVVERIARRLTGAEGGAADVNGVRAVLDRGDARVGVARRGEKFQGVKGKHAEKDPVCVPKV